MPVKNTQYLIIGQGLAGSMLVHTLRKRGAEVCVIDKPGASSSSVISAGLWNPVVFKRMTQSWKAAEVIPFMHQFFAGAQDHYDQTFLRQRRMMKFFTEEQEVLLWKKKQAAELHLFIDEKIYSANEFDLKGVESPAYAFSYVTESGNVDTAAFMAAVRTELIKEGRYYEEKFMHGQLRNEKTGFFYKDLQAEQVIFCEGHLNKENPFFGYLPFKPAKGEVLVFECADLELEVILNKGIFVLPLGGGFFKCGSTYEWNELNDLPTTKGQKELEDKLRKLIRLPIQIRERFAGVRPSVIDRRPVMGEHPQNKRMWIFNGMGTKAVMLAPFFANEFCNFMEGKGALDRETDIKRFLK